MLRPVDQRRIAGRLGVSGGRASSRQTHITGHARRPDATLRVAQKGRPSSAGARQVTLGDLGRLGVHVWVPVASGLLEAFVICLHAVRPGYPNPPLLPSFTLQYTMRGEICIGSASFLS